MLSLDLKGQEKYAEKLKISTLNHFFCILVSAPLRGKYWGSIENSRMKNLRRNRRIIGSNQ